MPRWRHELAAFISVLICAGSAHAWPELEVNGILDGRYILTGPDQATTDGGVGALRYGGKGDRDLLRLADASLIAKVKLDWDLDFVTHFRAIPEQRSGIDVIESYLKWHPVSTTNWRFSAKAGYFFPEISLENTSIAWTSPYTLTSSAINSWIGEEIRTLGAEASVEWRDGTQAIGATAGIFYGDDPAGVVVARYGFIMSDRITGLLDRVRLPDTGGVQSYAHPIEEIDGKPGGYFSTFWKLGDDLKLTGFLYDNNADPQARSIASGAFGWRTRFANVGFDAQLPADFELLGQAMTGITRVEPFGRIIDDVQFDSTYLMLTRLFGEHRVSLRWDIFKVTEQNHQAPFQHGDSATLAYVVYPFDSVRLTLEALYVNSFQPDALSQNLDPRLHEFQLQMSWRYYF